MLGMLIARWMRLPTFSLPGRRAISVHLAPAYRAVQFVEEGERTRGAQAPRVGSGQRIDLRLIETQAEAQKMARQVSGTLLTGAFNRFAFEAA